MLAIAWKIMNDAARDVNLTNRDVKDKSSSSNKTSSNSKPQTHLKVATNSYNNSKSSTNRCQLRQLLPFWPRIRTFHYLIRKETLWTHTNCRSSRPMPRSNLFRRLLQLHSLPMPLREATRAISHQVPPVRKMTVSRHKRIKAMGNRLLLRVAPLKVT